MKKLSCSSGLKSIVFLFLLFISFQTAYSQRRTFGVGVTTLNENAALQVDAPGKDQGFMMPRLTTAQRNSSAFLTQLGAGDNNGLMVYDTDLKAIYIWNGGQWVSSAKLSLPYADTVLSASNNSNLLRLVYAGSGVENVGVAQFENMNPSNGFSAVFGRTNSGSNGAADFVVDNPANNNDAVGVATNGTGTGIRVSQTGTGMGIVSKINNVNSTGPAIWGETNSNQALSAPIYGLNTGTGDVAASFRISNASNNFAALYAETNGGGPIARFNRTSTTSVQPAVYAQTKSGHGFWADHEAATGYAAILQNINVANPNAAVFVESIGTGPSLWAQKSNDAVGTGDAFLAEHLKTGGHAGKFIINNTASPMAVILASTNGSGAAIAAQNAGTGDGFAGNFSVTQATNTYPAVQASTKGSGSALRAFQADGPGHGVDVYMFNTTSPGKGIYIEQRGLNNVAEFRNTNATNSTAAVNIETNGTGFGLRSLSTGPEVAGYFETSNASANTSTVFALTNAPNGTGLGTFNSGNGLGLGIFGGGLRVSVATLSAGTSIATRAVAYNVTGGGPYSFGFALSDGDTFYVFNSTGAAVTVAGTSIAAGSGKTFIVLGGTARAF